MSHIQEQEWHHSGSSCCSPFGTCMLSWCCPCITYGRTHHRVKNDGNMQGYSCCNLSVSAAHHTLSRCQSWHNPPVQIPLLTLILVRSLHRSFLPRPFLHSSYDLSRRYPCQVPFTRQWMQGLSLCLLLPALRSHATGQGICVARKSAQTPRSASKDRSDAVPAAAACFPPLVWKLD
jgi:hypothetical protein